MTKIKTRKKANGKFKKAIGTASCSWLKSLSKTLHVFWGKAIFSVNIQLHLELKSYQINNTIILYTFIRNH